MSYSLWTTRFSVYRSQSVLNNQSINYLFIYLLTYLFIYLFIYLFGNLLFLFNYLVIDLSSFQPLSVEGKNKQRALFPQENKYENKLCYRMIEQLLNSAIAKDCDLSASGRSVICRGRELRQIIDLLYSSNNC